MLCVCFTLVAFQFCFVFFSYFLRTFFALSLYLGEVIYVAQHNFKGTGDSDLPFKKGDKLRVLQE